MAEPINIDDYRPHLLVELLDSSHVIPLHSIERIAYGESKADTKTAQCLAAALLSEIYAD